MIQIFVLWSLLHWELIWKPGNSIIGTFWTRSKCLSINICHFLIFYFVLWLYCMIVRNSVALPADDIRPPSVQHYTQELRGFSPYNSNPGPFLYTPFGSKNAMTHWQVSQRSICESLKFISRVKSTQSNLYITPILYPQILPTRRLSTIDHPSLSKMAPTNPAKEPSTTFILDWAWNWI